MDDYTQDHIRNFCIIAHVDHGKSTLAPTERKSKGGPMNQIMTLAEVNDHFDSEWVLLGDVEVGKNHEVLRGRVLWHSKDRDEVDRKLLELRPPKAATHFTGTIPEGVEVVL